MTDPLVPADVDLRDFGFMPLDVRTLLTSSLWIKAKKDPRVAHAAVSLWCECWHQVPAASLPDDDEVLAELARCDAKEWARIKERALLHFVKCSDGRLYHRHVAKKAIEAWDSKQAQRARTAAATAAREARRREQLAKRDDRRDDERNVERNEQRDVGRDGNRNEARDDLRDENRDVHQGTGTGTGKRKEPPNPPVNGEIVLPQWLPAKDWHDFLDHRKKIKKPMSCEAQRRAINRLDAFRQRGHDPAFVLDASIVNGWQGLFEPKPGDKRGQSIDELIAELTAQGR